MGKRFAITGAIAAATALLLGGAGVTVHVQADAACGELQAWIEQARASYQRRDFHRPVAWGPGLEDHAFAHYRRATELAPSAEAGLQQYWYQVALHELPEHAREQTAAEQMAVRAAWAPALAELRQGAHCVDARPWLDLQRANLAFNLGAARWLTNLSVIDSIEALARGDAQRAVQAQLDALTFGVDLMRSGRIDRLIAAAIANIVLMQGLDEDRVRRLDRPALELLAAGLARLDSDGLAVEEPTEEALWTVLWLQQDPDRQVRSPSWRFGFSSRWQTAQGLLAMCRYAGHAPAVPGSWPAREPVLRQWVEKAPDPWLYGCLADATTEGLVREALARLRCLRLSVDHHRGATLPDLADPLGDGPLTVEPREDGVRIASVGRVADGRIERIAVRR